HRGAAGVGLHAAAAAAGAASAVLLDDHVADLPGGAAPEPRLAVQDDAAAHTGTPEDADQRVEVAAGAQLGLGRGGDADVVADEVDAASHHGLSGAHTLTLSALGLDHAHHGVDQREVGEGLREVAQVAAARSLDLLRVELQRACE